MSKKEVKKSPPSLKDLMGVSDKMVINDIEYSVKPLKLKDVAEFQEDQPSVGPQYFAIANPEQKKVTDKWLQRQVDKDGEPVTLEMAMEDGWSVVDLREVILAIINVSG